METGRRKKLPGPPEDKGLRGAPENKTWDGDTEKLWVRVRPERAVTGLGGPGTVAQVARELAQYLVGIGFVDVIEAEAAAPDGAQEGEER